MRHQVTRRDFMTTTAAAGVGLMAMGQLYAAAPDRHIKKALIGNPTRKTLAAWKEAGFDGMESNVWQVTPEEAAKGKNIADELGMRIHSVMRGWANFNHPKPEVIAEDIASVETALRAAQAYGAETILLVPCRLLKKVDMPKPEDFDIEFNDKTCHVTRVAKGDNTPYDAYIKAQNRATDMTRKAVERLIPVAEKTGVIIALENVWNNFWVKPQLAAHFISSFQSPWVKSYYDIGNHVKYAMPEEWIRALGKLIVKLHVKDFKIDRSAPRGGSFVNIREGDVDWPLVMQELDKIGYHGWMTIEGSGRLSVEQRSKRLDLIIAGK